MDIIELETISVRGQSVFSHRSLFFEMVANLFDPNFYRTFNPDLAGLNDAQALQHLLTFGLNEGRIFSPTVDLNFYREKNPGLAAAGLISNRQLFDHLSLFGISEGRSFSPVLDLNYYRAIHPDLIAVGFNNEQLFEHFSRFGINEGRASSPEFNIGAYLDLNPGLVAAGLDNAGATLHYRLFGMQEGRSALPRIDIGTDPGNTIATALNLGTVFGSFEIEERVFPGNTIDPSSDFADFYHFRLDRDSQVEFELDATRGSGSLTLIRDDNNNGAIDVGETLDFATSRLILNLTGNVDGLLPAGNYLPALI